MKHIFILNGSYKNHPFESVINDIMKDKDYEIIRTKGNDDDFHITRQFFNQHNRIYSVGGDGMLNIVMQRLVNTDNELVVIPYGTGNDFFRYFSKEKDCRKILKQSLNKKARIIDTALVNDRYYLNTVCFGLDSIIANKVHDGMNIKFLQKQSYIIGIFKQIFGYRFRHVKIYDDDKLLYDGLMIVCTINNGRYYGGGFKITPNADVQDGILDICVVEKVSPFRIIYLLMLLILHRLEEKKDVHFFKSKHVFVEGNFSGNVDGEQVEYSRYEIKVVPQSIHIVI